MFNVIELVNIESDLQAKTEALPSSADNSDEKLYLESQEENLL